MTRYLYCVSFSAENGSDAQLFDTASAAINSAVLLQVALGGTPEDHYWARIADKQTERVTLSSDPGRPSFSLSISKRRK